MLLTDEEILKACAKLDDVIGWKPDYPSATDKLVAKAQLRKVAEHIKNLPTDGHDKWYFYNQDLAESLLKEVKDE